MVRLNSLNPNNMAYKDSNFQQNIMFVSIEYDTFQASDLAHVSRAWIVIISTTIFYFQQNMTYVYNASFLLVPLDMFLQQRACLTRQQLAFFSRMWCKR